MNHQTTVGLIISPEKYFSKNLEFSGLKGDTEFIEKLVRYVNALKDFQLWEREKIQEVQNQRLKILLNDLESRSKFWQKHLQQRRFDINAQDLPRELKKLPVLTRKDFLSNRFGRYSIHAKSGIEREHLMGRSSSGTSGLRVVTFKERMPWIISRCSHFLQQFQFTDDEIRSIFSRESVVDLGNTVSSRTFLKSVASVHLFQSVYDLDAIDFRKKIYDDFKRLEPIVFIAPASALSYLADYILEDKISFDIMGTLAAGEGISVEDRDRVEYILNTRVGNALTCSEGGHIGFLCPENPGKFHVYEDRGIIEVVDKDGRDVEVGQMGDILITALDSRVSPNIRYETGDIGRIVSYEKCTCGRNTTLFEFLGRRDAEIVFSSGKKLRSIYVHLSLNEAGMSKVARQFQIRQDRIDHLSIYVVPKQKDFDKKRLLKNVNAVLSRLFREESIELDIEYTEKIPLGPSGKMQNFVPLGTNV